MDSEQNTINELQFVKNKKGLHFVPIFLLAALIKWKWVPGPQKGWQGKQTELKDYVGIYKQEMSDAATYSFL